VNRQQLLFKNRLVIPFDNASCPLGFDIRDQKDGRPRNVFRYELGAIKLVRPIDVRLFRFNDKRCATNDIHERALVVRDPKMENLAAIRAIFHAGSERESAFLNFISTRSRLESRLQIGPQLLQAGTHASRGL
jgi:hypothetical protein